MANDMVAYPPLWQRSTQCHQCTIELTREDVLLRRNEMFHSTFQQSDWRMVPEMRRWYRIQHIDAAATRDHNAPKTTAHDKNKEWWPRSLTVVVAYRSMYSIWSFFSYIFYGRRLQSMRSWEGSKECLNSMMATLSSWTHPLYQFLLTKTVLPKMYQNFQHHGDDLAWNKGPTFGHPPYKSNDGSIQKAGQIPWPHGSLSFASKRRLLVSASLDSASSSSSSTYTLTIPKSALPRETIFEEEYVAMLPFIFFCASMISLPRSTCAFEGVYDSSSLFPAPWECNRRMLNAMKCFSHQLAL